MSDNVKEIMADARGAVDPEWVRCEVVPRVQEIVVKLSVDDLRTIVRGAAVLADDRQKRGQSQLALAIQGLRRAASDEILRRAMR